MKNQELKQKAIQEAYCKEFILTGNTPQDAEKRFKAISYAVDGDGWFCGNLHEVTKLNFEYSGDYCRPIRLHGIDTNNLWTRIDPDGSNLQEEGGYYKVGRLEGNEFTEGGEHNAWDVEKLFKSGFCTHYRPVTKHPKPIY